MEPMYWLIAMAILLVIEIITMGLTTIWFAAGALAAVVAALFHAPLIVQFALFLTVSVVLFCFTRPIAEKYLNTSISFSQFVRASSKKSIRCQPPFRRPRRTAGAARISCKIGRAHV